MLRLLLFIALIFQTAQRPPAANLPPPVEANHWDANRQHAPFPIVKDWKRVKITLERNACYGNCPWYSVEVHGDGSVFYVGKSNVALRGHHRGWVPQDNVLELVRAFERTDYYSLPDQFSPCPRDPPTQVTSIEIDGRRKQLFSCVAGETDTPASVSELELTIDRLSGSARWTRRPTDTKSSKVDGGRHRMPL